MTCRSGVRYSIWFNGQPIEFPGRLQANTGLPDLWKVNALAEWAEPTLLAASQRPYLIYLTALLDLRRSEEHDHYV